ncbi:Required for respiratory growth protein 9 mitochondrial [Ceratobasidium sp. 414]|nr:Required for respiratory growth protein 9 mitochondrial [Ceratobasidium sp. 414]
MALVISHRLGFAPLVHTRAISWGPGFTRKPISTPQTIQKSTSYKPARSRSEEPHRTTLSAQEKPNARSAEPRIYPPRPARRPGPTPQQYLAHKARMKSLYPEGWSPPRTISREAMDTLRDMHARDPIQFRTPVLASKFRISPEAVSRILKSKWRPSSENKAKMIARDNKAKDMAIAERMRVERAEAQKLFEGRPVLAGSQRGRES